MGKRKIYGLKKKNDCKYLPINAASPVINPKSAESNLRRYIINGTRRKISMTIIVRNANSASLKCPSVYIKCKDPLNILKVIYCIRF